MLPVYIYLSRRKGIPFLSGVSFLTFKANCARWRQVIKLIQLLVWAEEKGFTYLHVYIPLYPKKCLASETRFHTGTHACEPGQVSERSWEIHCRIAEHLAGRIPHPSGRKQPANSLSALYRALIHQRD